MAPGGPRPGPAHWRAAARRRTAPSARRAAPTWHTRGASRHPRGRRRGRARGARAPREPRAPRRRARRRRAAAARWPGRAPRERVAGSRGAAAHCTCTHAVSAPSAGRGVRSRAALSLVLSPNTSTAVVRAPAGTSGPGPQFPQRRTPPCLWHSCYDFPVLWVPPSLTEEEMGAPGPMPRSQRPLLPELPLGPIHRTSTVGSHLWKSPKRPTPPTHSPGPRAHTHASVGVFVDGPLFGPPRWGRTAAKPGLHLGSPVLGGQTAAHRTLGPATSSAAALGTCTPHLQSPPPAQGPLEL